MDRKRSNSGIIDYSSTSPDFYGSGISSLNTSNVGQVGKQAKIAESWNELEDTIEYNLENYEFEPDPSIMEEEGSNNDRLEKIPGMGASYSLVSALNSTLEDVFNPKEKYTGASGDKTNLTEQLFNINVRDALSVNIDARVEDLRSTEGKWLPEIETAKQYLEQKKTLAMLDPEAPNYQNIVDQVNELGKQVKQIAKTNPYIRDVFYGDYTIPAFTYPGQLHPQKISKDRIKKTLDNNKDSYDVDLSWEQNNNELSDKLTSVANIDTKLAKLQTGLNDANEEYSSKHETILNKQKALKTKHMLHDPLFGIVPLGLVYDPESIDPVFDQERSQKDISLFDPSSYKYGLSHLGSSMSELQAMGATMLIAKGIKWGAKLAGSGTGGFAPLIWAGTEAVFNTLQTTYFRDKETAAEVISNYTQKLIEGAQNDQLPYDLNRVLEDYEFGLKTRGYDTDKMDDLEKLKFGVAYGLPTSDENYNQFAKGARKGLTDIEQANDALALVDVAQNFGLSYGGALVKDSFKKGAKNIAGKVGKSIANDKTKKVIDVVNNKIDKAADKVFSNPMQKVATKHALTSIGKLAAATGGRYVSEAIEEGQQRLYGLDYTNRDITEDGTDHPYSIIQGAFQAGKASIDAVLAYNGLHWNDLYNTDEELKTSMQIGGFIGALMGVGANAKKVNELKKQLKADLSLQKLAAEGFDKVDRSFKTSQFLDSYRKGIKAQYITSSIEDAKQYRNAEVTDEMINGDIELANTVYNIYKNTKINPNLKELGIDRKSDEDFDLFVQNQVDLVNRFNEAQQLAIESGNDTNNIVSQLFADDLDNEFNKLLKQKYQEYSGTVESPVSYQEYKTPVVNAILARTSNKVLKNLKKDLTSRKKTIEQIKEEYGIKASTLGIDGILEYINRLQKQNQQLLDETDKTIFKGTLNKVQNPDAIDRLENALTVQIINNAISDIVAAKVNSYNSGRLPIQNRYMVEQKPLFSTLTNTEQNAVLTQYAEKYKQEHNTDQEPTRKQIISYYNNKINQSWNELEDNANVEQNERNLANAMFREDIRRAKEERQQAKIEIEEDFGVSSTEPEQPEVDTIAKSDQETKTSTEPDNNTGKDKKETSQEVSSTPDSITDDNNREGSVVTPVDAIETDINEDPDSDDSTNNGNTEINDIDAMLDDVADKDYVQDDSVIEITDGATDGQERAVNDKVSEDTLEEDALKAKYDQLEDGQPLVDVTEVKEEYGGDQEVNDVEQQPAQTSQEPTVEEQKKVEKEPEPLTPKSDKAGSVTLTPESYDGSSDQTVEVPIENQNNIIYSDGTDTWVGDKDPSLGTIIPETELQMQSEFEMIDAVDMGTTQEAANHLGQTDKSPGLDTKRKVETNRIHSTFFYAPTASEVMSIEANGKPVIFDGERRPGSELAKKLAIPGWLSKQKAYFIITDSKETRKTEKDAADRMGVHLIIEETTEDGKKLIYNTALYQPDKARTKIDKWRVSSEKRNKELNDLRRLRRSIISKYITTYCPDYFTNSNTKLPQNAVKGIVPVNLRQSNGSINSVTTPDKRPVYKSLTEVNEFGLSSNPIEMTQQILDGKVEFGYGKGPFPLNPDDAFSIVQFDQVSKTSSQGVGYAGKIYIVPPVANTPSQRNSAPIMLAEKRHFIAGGSKNLITSYTPDGKAKFGDDGQRIPLSTAELLFRLVTKTLPIANNPEFIDILDILVNHGPSTITVGDNRVEKLSFYIRKTLHYYTNDQGSFLMYANRTPQGTYLLKYLKIKDTNGRTVFTDQQAYDVIRQISNNLHWNTDKEAMMQPISDNIVNAAIAYMNKYNTDTYKVLNCEDLQFTMEDLNLTMDSNGKVVKKGETPILMSWMINHQVLKTDIGDTVFKDPFVYADDASVAETAKVSTEQEQSQPKKDKIKQETKPVEKPEVKEEITNKPEVKRQGKRTGDRALTYNETVAAGLTPRQGFTYVQKEDGKYVALPNSSKSLQKLLNRDKGVFSIERGEGQVDTDKAREWLQKTLGIDPEDVLVTNAVMKTAKVPQVYGLLQASFDRIKNEFMPRIALSSKAGKGIEYHEAWHYVSLLVLNPQYRNQVYSDFVKAHPEYAESSKRELEEVLAEEFRSYMLKESSPSIGYRIKKFFRAIRDLVNIFGNREINMQSEVFKAIRKGKFKNAEIDQDTLKEFSEANPSGVTFYAPGVSDEDQQKISHITNANTMYNIVEALSNTALSILNIQSMEDINNLKLDDIFDTIQYMYEDGEYDFDNTRKQIVSDVLSNKELFAKQIRSYLHDLGIREIEHEQTEIAEKEANDTGENYDNVWDRASYEISKKANVAFNAKLFFYSIPKSKFVLDKNGNTVLDSIKDNIFGLDMAQSFDVTWNKILDKLWNSNDWQDLISKVRNEAKADPFFARLLEKIDNPAFPLPENTVTQLLTTIQSAKNSMDTIDIINTSTGKISKATPGRGSNVWNVLDSSSLRKIARLPNQWSQNFMLSSMIITDKLNRSRINTIAFAKLSNLDKEIQNDIKTITKTINSKDPKVRINNVEQFEYTKQKFLNLVNMIGIPFDMESLNYLLKKIQNGKQDIPDFYVFKALYQEEQGDKYINGTIRHSIISNIRAMNNNKSLETTFKHNKISASRIFNYKSPNAVINLMAVAYGETHPTPEEFSVTGAGGSLLYPITQNNYMSDQLRWLNTDSYGKLVNLSKAEYSKNSLIVKALTSDNRPKLKLHTLIAVNDNVSNTSRDYFGITPIEDYIAKLVLVHSNRIILPTMSDKKTWYSIEGINMPKDFLNSVTYGADEYGQMEVTDIPRRFSNDTLDIFCNYFLDEYNAVVKYYNTKAEVEKGLSRYYDNYHGKIDKNGKMKPGGNGGRFRYFNQLNINGQIISLNKMLDDAEKSGDPNLINQALNEIKTRLVEDRILLRDTFNTLLLDKVNKEIENAIKLGVISRDKDGNLSYGNLPSTSILEDSDRNNPFTWYEEMTASMPEQLSTIKQNDIIYSMIANYVTGYAISIEEVEKCFVGDPAFYKWKSNGKVGIFQRDVDKIKRLSSVLSTGTNLRTYWGEGDPRNSTKFTSAILQDNMIGSEYHSKLQQIFKADLTRTMLRKNSPSIDDNYLFELTNEKNLNSTLQNRNLLSEADVEFIEKQAIKSADPYAYDEENNSGNINQADAAVYIRPAFYKRIVQSLGEWSPEIEEAFEILERDPEVDPETGEVKTILDDPDLYAKALKASIKPLKMMYFGDHFDEVSSINVPVFDKMALFPMFKVLANADNKALYDRMNNEELGTIDMLKFESSTKVGSPANKLRVYKDNKNTQLNTEAINKPSTTVISSNDTSLERLNNGLTTRVQDIKQLRLQLNTEPHEHTDRSFGTQAVKICIANVVDSRTYGGNKGKNITGDQIKRDVFGCIKALSTKGYTKLKGRNGKAGRFFDAHGHINNKALSEYLIKEATGTNMSAEIVEALSLDKNGNFKAPIASLSTRNWIESKIVSLINKEVIDVNTPGGSAIQMASFGFRSNLVKDEKWARPFNDGNKLSFDPSKGSMEVMLSTNFFRDVVPQEFQKDYATMRNWLIEHNIIGSSSNPYGIGYRIPTQGLSSTFSFIVADVLPAQTGDTIVVPDEFTAMTGSDFDIDKLYIATYSYDPKTNERYSWDDSKQYYSDQSEGALINKLLDSYTLVISDEKTLAETRASIDTLTGILKKDILPLVQETEIKEAEPMYELMPSFQESRKTEYTSGKAGIAPFALNSTNHCLTQATHLKMKYSESAKKYGLGLMDVIDGQDGYKILDWLSAMINAHVDVAKDPYIIILNVNQVTYNMTSFLLRTGKGRNAFLFLAQPALKEYANRKIMNNGVIGVNKQFDNEIFKDIKQYYLDMLNRYPLSTSFKQQVEELMKDGSSIAFDHVKLTNSLQAFKTGNITPQDIVQQLLVIKAYQDLSSDAQTMADLVQRSQIDTKKYGINISQLQNFYNSYTTFKDDNENKFYINNPEQGGGLDEYFSKTFLHKKLMYAMDLTNSMLKSQVFSATNGYKQIFSALLQEIRGGNYTPTNNGRHYLHKYKYTSNKEYIKALNDKVESIVRAKSVMNNTNLRISDEEINELLFGKNSVARRLNYVKNYIRQNKDNIELLTLVDNDGNIVNELLNYLQGITMTDKKLINYINTATSTMNNSRYYEDRLRSGFYDLLTSNDKTIREFAETLVKYAFLTSYDNRTPNSFFNLVPMQYKEKIGYIDSIKDTINRLNYGDPTSTDSDSNFSQQISSIHLNIVRNYWKDNEIVPTLVRKVKKTEDDFSYSTNVKDLASAKDSSHSNVNTIISVIGSYDLSNNHKFFKIVGTNGKTEVYQRVGDIIDLESGKTVERIYTVVQKLGYDAGSNSIYELYKDGNEPSAFATNKFTDKMIQQTTIELQDIINKRTEILNRKNAVMFVKDEEYKNIDFSNYDSIDENVKQELTDNTEQVTQTFGEENVQEASQALSEILTTDDFVDSTLDPSEADNINHIDDTLLSNLDGMETENVISIEDMTPDASIETGIENLIEDIVGTNEAADDTITEISEGTVSNLKKKGKQRKNECK